MQFGNTMKGGTRPRGEGGKEGGARKKSDRGQEKREEEKGGGGRGRVWSSDASTLYPFVF